MSWGGGGGGGVGVAGLNEVFGGVEAILMMSWGLLPLTQLLVLRGAGKVFLNRGVSLLTVLAHFQSLLYY